MACQGADTEEAMETVNRIHRMLVCAIVMGTEIKIAYDDFKEPATIQDLARIDKAVTRLVRDVLRTTFKLKPAQIPKMRLSLPDSKFVDDGDNTVTVTLDFGKILPGERPPELLALCKKTFPELVADDGAPAPAGVEG
jgi:hypothetical protein